MKLMSRAYEAHMEEQQRKQDALLDIPDQIAETNEAVETLALRLEQSAVIIAQLESQLSETGSLKGKLKDYFIGGVIGAILGVIVSKLFG
jgi:septal ring factor EnvC (AmiA/AmiB activator)